MKKVLNAACALLIGIFTMSSVPVCDPTANGVHFPSETDCSHFYTCNNGQAIEQSCPPGLEWSVSEDRCTWPSEAGCGDGSGGGEGPGRTYTKNFKSGTYWVPEGWISGHWITCCFDGADIDACAFSLESSECAQWVTRHPH